MRRKRPGTLDLPTVDFKFGGDIMRDMPMTEDHVGSFLAAHAPANCGDPMAGSSTEG